MATSYAEELNKESSRNANFLQGVAASAIAFALHEATSWHSLLSLAPAALSVICLGMSFYFGTLFSHAVQRFYGWGALGSDPKITSSRKREIIRERTKAKHQIPPRYRWQLRFLLAGAILYFVATGVNIHQLGMLTPTTVKK